RVYILNTATNAVIGTIPLDTTNNAYPLSIAMTPGPTRVISLSGNLAFGPVKVGATRSATLTIANTGNSPLTVNSIAFPAGFIGDWMSGTIAAGGAQNVTVTFAPTALTSYGGTITVNANQTSGGNKIVVSGSGGMPTRGDFDGDLKADITIYRPSTGTWSI